MISPSLKCTALAVMLVQVLQYFLSHYQMERSCWLFWSACFFQISAFESIKARDNQEVIFRRMSQILFSMYQFWLPFKLNSSEGKSHLCSGAPHALQRVKCSFRSKGLQKALTWSSSPTGSLQTVRPVSPTLQQLQVIWCHQDQWRAHSLGLDISILRNS